ncbi:unnamed protein product [Linum tenue]|uniref:Uncharacterized protein n=1 Tax=Linum tenue TaxID=586396 RepID=A0AAV0NXJ7_9ROSI|nr:unnamed protein product [Linum tenue]
MASDEGGEYELVYFRRLDDEFNKVNRFYKCKVEEVLKEADSLTKQMDEAIEEGSMSHEQSSSDGSSSHDEDDAEKEEEKTKNQSNNNNGNVVRLSPLEVLDHVKMNNTSETPRSTIKGFLKVPRHTELKFTRENLRKVEERLKRAFVEFYQKLRLLKSYSFLNTLAFSKIMKKYDKITSRSASAAYMRMVDNSYLGSSDDVTRLMERVEATFIKHFSNANRSKGMSILRPKAKRERHRTTFTMGFFSGCAAALFIALIGSLQLLLVMLFLPFNILYRSSRFFLLTCIFHCIAAPLYKVTLPDFFLGDQLTSQVQAIRSLEFYVCYYGWGDFRRRENTCTSSGLFNTFNFIVAVIPFVARLLQCLRRLFEEKDPMQGLNGLKYFVTIVAVTMRTAYVLDKGFTWLVLAWVFSAIAAIGSTYWDLVFDWGLLQRHSKNWWLRDKLLVPSKRVYYLAMVLNVLLRFAWLQTVLGYNLVPLHKQTTVAIVASLEIIRRGIWNFFRLENEHLNNVGKYRAFKSVPLPFNYDEDGDKDE